MRRRTLLGNAVAAVGRRPSATPPRGRRPTPMPPWTCSSCSPWTCPAPSTRTRPGCSARATAKQSPPEGHGGRPGRHERRHRSRLRGVVGRRAAAPRPPLDPHRRGRGGGLGRASTAPPTGALDRTPPLPGPNVYLRRHRLLPAGAGPGTVAGRASGDRRVRRRGEQQRRHPPRRRATGPSPRASPSTAWRSSTSTRPRRRPALPLDEYYRKSVVGGPGAFLVLAEAFESFGVAVRRKLICEISGLPPPRRKAEAKAPRRFGGPAGRRGRMKGRTARDRRARVLISPAIDCRQRAAVTAGSRLIRRRCFQRRRWPGCRPPGRRPPQPGGCPPRWRCPALAGAARRRSTIAAGPRAHPRLLRPAAHDGHGVGAGLAEAASSRERGPPVDQAGPPSAGTGSRRRPAAPSRAAWATAPIPASTPRAAEHHSVAAVFRPRTFSPSLKITPAPMKPMPEPPAPPDAPGSGRAPRVGRTPRSPPRPARPGCWCAARRGAGATGARSRSRRRARARHRGWRRLGRCRLPCPAPRRRRGCGARTGAPGRGRRCKPGSRQAGS